MSKKKGKRLCKLADKKFLKENFNEYIRIVAPPSYICRKCGRAAVAAENLCKPKKIQKSG